MSGIILNPFLYTYSINLNLVLFFVLMDRLNQKLFLWKLSWAIEKTSFHEGKDCYINGYKKLLYMGC